MPRRTLISFSRASIVLDDGRHNVRKQPRNLVVGLCFIFLFAATGHSQETDQPSRSATTRGYCGELYGWLAEKMRLNQNQGVVDGSRRWMSYCTDVSTPRQQAMMLESMGMALLNLKQYEDAVGVLRRCVSIDAGNASCWRWLGVAYDWLGKLREARDAFRNAIETGGVDEESASAIEYAKERLARLESGEDGSKGARTSLGTGFFVSGEGHILTNNHVVAECRFLRTREGAPLQVIARKPRSDLALLKGDVSAPESAVFRGGASPQVGESVVVFGFPLPTILSSEGNVSTGTLSATAGMQDDVRYIQISAPVQPGNSGGPLLDSSGYVIGVIVSKLDALRIAQLTGDVPQNINFAVHWSGVRTFLEEEGVKYREDASKRAVTVTEIAAMARRMSVAIQCVE